MQVWIALARAYGAAMACIEQALHDKKLPPLSWYDILRELERAGPEGLRQFELEHGLLLRQYNVSRLVERIEREGYLRREPCKRDRRGKRLMITSEGQALRRRMWLIYGPKIQETIGQHLSEAQCHDLGALLAPIGAKPT